MGHIGVGFPARLHGLVAGTGWVIELGESFSNGLGAVVILDVPTLVTIRPAVVKRPVPVEAGACSDVPTVTPGTVPSRCGAGPTTALPHATQAMAAPQTANLQRFTSPAY
jgi:hypothetical protein